MVVTQPLWQQDTRALQQVTGVVTYRLKEEIPSVTKAGFSNWTGHASVCGR